METMVRCVECGYDNSPQYRFCGMCGVTLRPPETTPDREVDSRRQVSLDTVEPVSGPSFLGLAGDNSPGAEYLLDDTSSQGHGKLFVFLVLLLAAAGFLGWRWHRYGYILPKNALVIPHPGNAPPAAAGENGQIPPGAENANNTVTGSTPSEGSTPAIEELDQQSSNSTPATGASAQNSNQQAPKPGTNVPNANQEAANTEQSPDTDTAEAGTEEPEANTSPGNAAAAKTPAEKSGSPTSTATQPASPSATKHAGVAVVAKNTHPKTIPTSAARPKSATENAPEQSESDALATQGERYLYGTGVAQNCSLAERSLLSAASRGSAHAETLLGAMYATGHCATRNLPTAYRWFARALHQQPTNGRLSADLEVLWKQMTPEERQLATKAE